MTTAGALVKAAFREGNLIPIGQAPKPAEMVEGLSTLNSYMLSKFGTFVGNKLRDWRIPPLQGTGTVHRTYPLLGAADLPLTPQFNLYPPINARVVWDGTERTVYFPERPQDGSVMGLIIASGAAANSAGTLTLNGNGLTINGEDTYTTEREDFTPMRWFYRADLGDWLPVVTLAEADESLFPEDVDDFWITGVSIRLAPRFGKQVAEATVLRLREMTTLMRSRYAQSEPTTSGGELLVPGYESFTGSVRWMQ